MVSLSVVGQCETLDPIDIPGETTPPLPASHFYNVVDAAEAALIVDPVLGSMLYREDTNRVYVRVYDGVSEIWLEV